MELSEAYYIIYHTLDPVDAYECNNPKFAEACYKRYAIHYIFEYLRNHRHEPQLKSLYDLHQKLETVPTLGKMGIVMEVTKRVVDMIYMDLRRPGAFINLD